MWFWLTVLAGTASVGHHLIDRYLLRQGKDPIAFAFLFQFLGMIFILPILPFDFRINLEPGPILWLSLIGVMDVATITLMAYMHRNVEASISSTVVRLRMIWALILAVVFLGEKMAGGEALGAGLIFLGLLAVSYKYQRFGGEIRYSFKKIIFPLLFSLTCSVESILMKAVAKDFSAAVVFFADVFPSIVVLPVIFGDLPRRAKTLFRGNCSWFLLTALFATAGLYSFQWALRFGEVSKIIPVYESLSLLTILGGIVLLKEREGVGQKIFGAILAAIGVILIRRG